MRTFRRIRHSIAAFLLILYLPACHHYVTPKGVTPQEYIVAKHPKRVRVTLADASRLTLGEPWVSADSLGGRLLPARDSQGSVIQPEAPTWAVPLSDVRRLEGWEFDEFALGFLLVAASVPVVLVKVVAATGAGG